jgi:arylsulfatase A-like enzyme
MIPSQGKTDTQPFFVGTMEIMCLAVSMGLLAGFVEGAGLLTLQHFGWLNWNMAQMSVEREILYISPIFDLVLFCLLGVILLAALPLFGTRPTLRGAVFLFSFLMWFDWLNLSGHLRMSGAFFLALGLATVCLRWFRGNEAWARRTVRRGTSFLLVFTALLFAFIQAGQRISEWYATRELAPAATGAPNVLVLVMDTVRADHLSLGGYGRATSPHLEQLARQGTLFDGAISTSSWTLPAHVSMLTGRPPHEHGAERGAYDGRYRTLAEAMRSAGYRTGAFSANYFFFSRQTGFGPGFLHFEDVFGSLADCAARTLYGRKIDQFVLWKLGYENIPGRKSAADVNRALLNWLDRDRSHPFFGFVNYFDAHDPYLPPQPYRSRFSKEKNPGGVLNSFVLRHDLRSPGQLQGEIDAYDGALLYLDEQIGNLVAGLDRRGLLQNTLLVIVSDHGESFGEHGLLLHRNALYRETIRVPLLFAWPGHVPAGVRNSQPVSISSIPGTIFDLLGLPDPALFPAPSLTALWREPTSAPAGWPDALAELAQFRFELVKRNPAYLGSMASLVSPEWQFILHQTLGAQLYNWKQDPQQLNNQAATSQGAKSTAAFTDELQNRGAGFAGRTGLRNAQGGSP